MRHHPRADPSRTDSLSHALTRSTRCIAQLMLSLEALLGSGHLVRTTLTMSSTISPRVPHTCEACLRTRRPLVRSRTFGTSPLGFVSVGLYLTARESGTHALGPACSYVEGLTPRWGTRSRRRTTLCGITPATRSLVLRMYGSMRRSSPGVTLSVGVHTHTTSLGNRKELRSPCMPCPRVGLRQVLLLWMREGYQFSNHHNS